MRLKDWMTSQNIGVPALAELVGATRQAVDGWARGRHIPRPDMMRRLVQATGGAVQPQDFYSDAPDSEVA